MPETAATFQVRDQLADRQRQLQREIGRVGAQAPLTDLLREVDAALARVSAGTYGLCETCHDTIEQERLAADPLVRFCLDHLPAAEQRALERDLQLASQIQRALLPPTRLEFGPWQVAYHYVPARIVSGDYCDLITTPAGELYFMVGDVSGKGVAASMLMAHLHAMFRALVPAGLPLPALLERASRVFCESTLPMHYATLVCGRATPDGYIEICNAGHPPPLLIRSGAVEPLSAHGLPIGMFCGAQFTMSRLMLAPGDNLLIYTDGVLDAEDRDEGNYGSDRLNAVASRAHRLAPPTLVQACVTDLAAHVAGRAYPDDVTLMAIGRL
jgi:phosphoserine phosphatase RsbU/P